MDIPTPPTDSLYKFKAIAGGLFLLGIFFIAYKVLEAGYVYRVELAKMDAATWRLIDKAFNWGRWMWGGAAVYALGETYAAFRQWRIKIQEPQDELLQLQLEQARLAVAKSRREAAGPVNNSGDSTRQRPT